MLSVGYSFTLLILSLLSFFTIIITIIIYYCYYELFNPILLYTSYCIFSSLGLHISYQQTIYYYYYYYYTEWPLSKDIFCNSDWRTWDTWILETHLYNRDAFSMKFCQAASLNLGLSVGCFIFCTGNFFGLFHTTFSQSSMSICIFYVCLVNDRIGEGAQTRCL